MTSRSKFEAACAAQNQRRAAEVAAARSTGAPCAVVTMFAFNGVPYCTTHRVMGPCPYAARVAS